MKTKCPENNITYHPLFFIIGTFLMTWCFAFSMTVTDPDTHALFFIFLDFMENASPLLCALIPLAQYLFKDKFIQRFFLGKPAHRCAHIIVCLLFVGQFLNFYLFCTENNGFSVHTFMITFVGQFLFGGGLEEAGWRGYLLPCFYRKYNILLSSVLVSIIWVLWHLPYFLIPGSMQAGGSFLSYSLIGIITGFILTAIYLLTGSVLLCMLFHSWQNTIVISVPADMSDFRFMLFFLLLGIISLLICLYKSKKECALYGTV